MEVEPELSKAILDEEFAKAEALADSLGCVLERLGDLKVKASLPAREIRAGQKDVYVFHFTFDNYKACPPLIDVVHPTTDEVNLTRCFPEGHCLGYFHEKKRICAEWSRRAYKDFDGPHPEWEYGNWEQKTSPPVRTFAEMLVELWRALQDATYGGRSA